ncbi:hypothetical protein [Helicobacter sp.]|uniref:hypothetical protein n=1 Tax=Helicobacter sp. TaxID=218 RepID=UPI0019A184CF|nr:hypothetical protein [Helicobacter sp.]MBD5165946.1 glycosyltransferase family 4 protein [Helicobacter sp.]
MRILCITDKPYNEEECTLKGVFEKYLLEYAEVHCAYFTKDSRVCQPQFKANRFILPYSTKHRKFIQCFLNLGGNLLDYDYIIVRNFYGIAKQILPFHKQVIFWETFPHDYRRLYEAQRDKKHLWRKKLEYKIKFFLHNKILNKCIAYMGSTLHFKSFHQLNIPIFSLPNGIDFDLLDLESISHNTHSINQPLKLIYIGSIDANRELAKIVEAISEAKGEFVLDIFSGSSNKEVEKILHISTQDSRITLHPPLPFTEMLQRLSIYDIGLGIIPNTPLYSVSSPIKAMEYAGNGVIPLLNDLPEYLRLFDESTAFFTQNSPNAITQSIERILNTPKEHLLSKKQATFKNAQAKMDYKVIAKNTYEFLLSLHSNNIPNQILGD